MTSPRWPGNGWDAPPHVPLGPCPLPPDERLTAGRVLSHLGVMVAVAAVMGVVVAGLAIPFAGVLGIGARDVAKGMDNLPTELEDRAAGPEDPDHWTPRAT